MQTTKQLIERAKKAQCIASDYKLAQVLGITQSAITNWNSGRSHPDDLIAAKLAEMAGQDPSSVIAELHAVRAKTPEARQLWMRMASQLRHAVAAVMMALGAVMLFGAPNPQGAMASTLPYDGNGPASVRYVKCCTRRILREIAALARGTVQSLVQVMPKRLVSIQSIRSVTKNNRDTRATAFPRAPLPAGA